LFRLERLPSRQSVAHGVHGIPGLAELELHEVTDVGVVIGHEDSSRACHGHAPFVCPRTLALQMMPADWPPIRPVTGDWRRYLAFCMS